MGFSSNGRASQIPVEERLNVFALVIYIPDPLGAFLDDLRRELVPQYNPHAHVSVLPPRSLAVDWQAAREQLRTAIEGWTPFAVTLTDLQIFPVTNVLYLELGGGAAELREMHESINRTELHFDEPFLYHPHVTLAQEVPQEDVGALHCLAQKRWNEYRGPRTFRAERAVFVQNTLHNIWIDLADYTLGALTLS